MPADWSCPEQQYAVTDFDPLDPENHVTVGDISLRVQSDGDACGPALVTARVACAGQGETFAFEIPRGATDGAVLAVRLLHATDPPAGDLGSAFGATRLAQFEGALSLRDGWLVPGLRVPVRLDLHYTLVRDARPVVPTGEPDAPAPSRRTRARFSGVVEVVAPER